ncbi:MAG TPA: sigma-70 family RNA polymerase sigma factor [Polyangiaceae bacterium]|jgi:RNA polymerase sigma-70 factor (ECF subfamily)|nr:sigma-70 family RNA polymerase sigma factor [Polyangiaceae bacterium]
MGVARESATRSGAGPSDAALVVSSRAGEDWAREALFRRHARAAGGLAFRLTGRDADVDDLVQESFMIAFERLDRLDNPQAFSAWLFGIVVRRAHKVLRRRRLLTRLGFRGDALDLEWVTSSCAPPDVVTELREIYRRIESLPPKLRIPLVLRRVEGLPHADIAEMTGASIATVKRRIAQAEDALDIAEERKP